MHPPPSPPLFFAIKGKSISECRSRMPHFPQSILVSRDSSLVYLLICSPHTLEFPFSALPKGTQIASWSGAWPSAHCPLPPSVQCLQIFPIFCWCVVSAIQVSSGRRNIRTVAVLYGIRKQAVVYWRVYRFSNWVLLFCFFSFLFFKLDQPTHL